MAEGSTLIVLILLSMDLVGFITTLLKRCDNDDFVVADIIAITIRIYFLSFIIIIVIITDVTARILLPLLLFLRLQHYDYNYYHY